MPDLRYLDQTPMSDPLDVLAFACTGDDVVAVTHDGLVVGNVRAGRRETVGRRAGCTTRSGTAFAYAPSRRCRPRPRLRPLRRPRPRNPSSRSSRSWRGKPSRVTASCASTRAPWASAWTCARRCPWSGVSRSAPRVQRVDWVTGAFAAVGTRRGRARVRRRHGGDDRETGGPARGGRGRGGGGDGAVGGGRRRGGRRR